MSTQSTIAQRVSKAKAGEAFLVAALVAFFFEGAVRKWILSSDSDLRYFVVFSREALAFIGFSLLPATRSPNLHSLAKLIRVPMVLTGIACTLAMTMAVNYVGAAMTIRSLLVLPLATCMLAGKLTSAAITKLQLTACVLIALNAPLSVLQYTSPQTSYLNKYVGEGSDIATAGYSTRVRATGTFSYITGLGIASVVAASAGFLLINAPVKPWHGTVGVIGLLASCITATATVSRGPTLIIASLIVAWVLTSPNRLQLMALMTALAGMGAIIGYVQLDEAQLESTLEFAMATVTRFQLASDNILTRIANIGGDAYLMAGEAPFGNGLGLGQSAGLRFGNAAVVETEPARLVYEIGIFGLLGFLGVYVGALLQLVRSYSACKNRLAKSIIAGCLFEGLALLISGVAFNHISSMAFWGVVAIGLRVPELWPNITFRRSRSPRHITVPTR